MYKLDALLDPQGAAALRAAIDSLNQPLGEDDVRSPKQRRADALVEIVHQALDRGTLPPRNGVRPHINVNTSIEALKGELGTGLVEGSELDNGMPVSSKTVQRLACDGTLCRVLKADSVVVDVGRATRAVSPAQLRALKARHRTCAAPGCDRPINWTNPHHVDFWSQGGKSNLPNLLPLWGLLPNSSRRPTIWAASFLAYVSAGGAALDGVQSGRAEALPELLVGRRRSRQPHRASTRSCGRVRICPQLDQAALQQHRTAIGRPGGLIQALAARLSLQHSERASPL